MKIESQQTRRQIRIAELKRIYQRDKELRASVVVKEATPSKSPLHQDFEWDDKVAGHEYRISQARQIIKTTPVISASGAVSTWVHVPTIVSDSPTAVIAEREGIYRPVEEVVKSPSEYVAALREMESYRSAMNRSIRQLKRAAKKIGKGGDLLVRLEEELMIVKQTLQLLINEAA